MSDGHVPAWMNKKRAGQVQNKRSKKHEERLAEQVGGKRVVGSGTSWRAPQDVKSDTHMIQHKYTDKASFSLKVPEMEQIHDDAERAGRGNALVIDFDKYGIRAIVTFERT